MILTMQVDLVHVFARLKTQLSIEFLLHPSHHICGGYFCK